MWICLNDAFVSAVQDKNNKALIMVRGRIPGDVEAFLKPLMPTPEAIYNQTGMKVTETNDADYRFRVLLTRRQMSELVAYHAEHISYTNFKSSIDETDKVGVERHDAYLGFWSIMHRWQNRVLSRG